MKHYILVSIKAVFAIIISANGFSQCPYANDVWKKITSIDIDENMSYANKLGVFYAIKKTAEDCKIYDSVYALVLLKIGKYEYYATNTYATSIRYTADAIKVNNSSPKGNSKGISINSYYNLASYYQGLMFNKKALAYNDTVISLCRSFVDTDKYVLDARSNKASIYFSEGDYQRAIDESIEGMYQSILEKDSAHYTYFLNRKAQSLYFLDKLQQAIEDAKEAIPIAQKTADQFELATAYKTLGLIYEKMNSYQLANSFFRQSVVTRILTGNYQQIASDYIDWGNFYLNSLEDYANARKCYNKTLEYAKKDKDLIARSLKIALAKANLGENSFRQHKFKEAEGLYLESFNELKINLHGEIKASFPSSQLSVIANKDLVIVLLNDKTQMLLALYKITGKQAYLDACVETALLTDTVITQLRHEHVSDLSKLYWRNKTRFFFNNAMEACHLANNPSLAFYFMEKSRAVLLNDQLNKISAAVHLPSGEAVKQEAFQMNMIEEQQKLSALNKSSPDYATGLVKLLGMQEDFEHYIKSLEQKYPVYYQSKYADNVPSLDDLQQYLARTRQSFVHYYINDTVTYILGITANRTKFIKLSGDQFNSRLLTRFMQLCSDKEELNKHYEEFIQLSNSVYTSLFKPLDLQKGRVIICADNFLIPFEALSADTKGKHFLVYDFAFSYVYSARYLMNEFNHYRARGDFLGIAPVSFAPYLGVVDLKESSVAINASANFYNNVQLLINQKAGRTNFLKQLPGYTVVNIFSHARADTSDKEPMLFMTDSVIYLSELQLISNPSTKLVVLSACQTNVGRNAAGEGIYSLARGFAAAGIPAVSATLWKADEGTVYSISEAFNKNLSLGMTKDEALQKAKLSFLESNKGSNNKMLPYYWATMILVGNTDPVKLSTDQYHWWWMAAGGLLVLLTGFFFLRRKKVARKVKRVTF